MNKHELIETVSSKAEITKKEADLVVNATLDAIIEETLSAVTSERTSRVIDRDGGEASMEKRKREGYF